MREILGCTFEFKNGGPGGDPYFILRYVYNHATWGGVVMTPYDPDIREEGGYENPDNVVIEDADYWIFSPGECVSPNSDILVSQDGNTIEAQYLKEDSSIAYYDFESNQVEIGKVAKAYIHPKATNFVRYEFEDGTYLEATDYHPIYTAEDWKSLTRRNGYEVPEIGDEVKTETGWKKLVNIEQFTGLEDCYDFAIETKDGKRVNNYFANGTLVQGSY